MSEATQVLGAMVMLSRATLLLTVTNDGMEGNGRTVNTRGPSWGTDLGTARSE